MAKTGGGGSGGIEVSANILASVKPLLSEAGADTHTLSLAISVLEALACSAPPAPADEAATGRGEGMVSMVVQEMVETASAPSTHNRVLQRWARCPEPFITVRRPWYHDILGSIVGVSMSLSEFDKTFYAPWMLSEFDKTISYSSTALRGQDFLLVGRDWDQRGGVPILGLNAGNADSHHHKWSSSPWHSS